MHRNPGRSILLVSILALAFSLAVGGCATQKAPGTEASPTGGGGSVPSVSAKIPAPQTEALPDSSSTAPVTARSPGSGSSAAAQPGQPGGGAQSEPGLGDAFFAFDDYSLTAEAKSVLAKDAQFLKANPAMRVKIEGHCDERGTSEYNLGLGERRAASARGYLASLGIDGSRLETISFGKERPFDAGRTEEAWAKNRRAHFVVISR